MFRLAGVSVSGADGVLAAASSLLQVDDSDGTVTDVSCLVELRRVGATQVIGTQGPNGVTVTCGGSTVTMPGGAVTTAAQLAAIRCASGDQAGDAIAVGALSFCGISGNFNGCARNNRALVVVPGSPDSTWAHELGHVQGIGHNPACTDAAGNSTCGTSPCSCTTATAANQRNIMFCQGCAGLDTISANECTAFRAPP